MTEELEVWRKLLGHAVQSFTHEDKTYKVLFTDKGWSCDCPDFKYRKGSYIFNVEGYGSFTGCKHIAKVLRDNNVKGLVYSRKHGTWERL